MQQTGAIVLSRPRLRRRLQARGANDLTFTGILCTLDEPSDRPPQSSDNRSHRTVIPRALAAKTLHQLQGMPVNVDATFSGHQKRQIVGVLDKAWIDGHKLMVQGRLLDKNQPELVQLIQANKGRLGMSFETANVAVESESSPVWTLTDLTWTGCALLDRSKAAYQSTAVSMAAQARRR